MGLYRQKLRDPRWQRRRLEVLQRDDWTCQFCLSRTKTLDVHHCRYHRGVDPWDYPLSDLLTLCRDCHQEETEQNNAPHLRAAGVVRELRKIGPRQSEFPAASDRRGDHQVIPLKPHEAPALPRQPARPVPASGYYAGTREGLKKITVAISPEYHRKLKIFAVDRGGIEKVMAEAIEDLFSKHGIE